MSFLSMWEWSSLPVTDIFCLDSACLFVFRFHCKSKCSIAFSLRFGELTNYLCARFCVVKINRATCECTTECVSAPACRNGAGRVLWREVSPVLFVSWFACCILTCDLRWKKTNRFWCVFKQCNEGSRDINVDKYSSETLCMMTNLISFHPVCSWCRLFVRIFVTNFAFKSATSLKAVEMFFKGAICRNCGCKHYKLPWNNSLGCTAFMDVSLANQLARHHLGPKLLRYQWRHQHIWAPGEPSWIQQLAKSYILHL